MDCVAQTRAVAERIKAKDLDGAMLLRGGSSATRSNPGDHATGRTATDHPGRRRFRLAVMHGGGPAPGHEHRRPLGGPAGPRPRLHACWPCKNGFRGLRDGDVQEMGWMDVSGWVSVGGAEIGTNRYVPRR